MTGRMTFSSQSLDDAVTRYDAGEDIPSTAHTGWRLKFEVLSRKWGRSRYESGTVTLLTGEAKNREPRTFYFTPRLRQILEAQGLNTDG